ncbi:MFS transporter [Streptomyces sp. A7024]|uniref:MFS transporter n=1 Tax=Streptomyces coryli TaxID=1128680 RepID=A0A6G4TTI4_9ACTN|nr:MFS transporter [Streptomyces coryli]NGN63295.1 MFS transporter [Streptomyces coryli]
MPGHQIVPPPGSPRRLAYAQLANSVGDGAYYVTSALYFTDIVGLSPARVGLALTLGWGLGAVAGVPLGHLADRRGARGTAVLLSIATAAAVASFLFARSWPAFLAAALLYTCCQCGLGAARQALLAGLVEPDQRTAVRAHLQSTTNAGLAIGAALGGVALAIGTESAYLAAFALDAACFLLSALVLLRLPKLAPTPPATGGEATFGVVRDRPYALITVLNAVLLLYMPLLSLIIPLWIVRRTDAPAWLVSGLLVLNTVSVVVFQVRIAQRVNGITSAARAVRSAGALMLVACVGFAAAAHGSGAWVAALLLLAGAVIQVAAEMMLASGGWELSFGLAPEGKHGQYQGFFGSGQAVARMLGPLLLTSLILGWGAGGWLLLGGVFLAAGAGMVPAARWAAGDRAAGGSPAVKASSAAAPYSGPTAAP